jgi:predicted DCC family thiol-disulfide oxidoreductase YuxK
MLDKPVIFFDGECNLCNGFVDLLLQIDREHQFYLAPLQGDTAQQYLPPLPQDPQGWSIAYVDGKKVSFASDAVIAIAEQLGGMWGIVALAKPLPQNFRDYLYYLVASNRYRLFGQSSCRAMTFDHPSPFLP